MESVTWSAVLIASGAATTSAPRLRTEFLPAAGHGPVAAAVWHVSARGVVEAHLGGRPVSEDVLTPGFSSYEWRLRYRTYDVAELLADSAARGSRSSSVSQLGHGWYSGRLAWTGDRGVYGDRPAAIAQLEITYADGHRQVVGTDASWTAGPSPVLADDLYDGQTIDARLTSDAWLQTGFTDTAWSPAESDRRRGPVRADRRTWVRR